MYKGVNNLCITLCNAKVMDKKDKFKNLLFRPANK